MEGKVLSDDTGYLCGKPGQTHPLVVFLLGEKPVTVGRIQSSERYPN